MEILKEWAQSVENLFFPKLCIHCRRALGSGEPVLCLHCLSALSYTNYHLISPNPVENKFKGRITIRKGASFLRFSKKGITQSLIHHLKYQGRKDIGFYLGQAYAEELKKTDFLGNINLLVPVPLHPKKAKKRGYNQSLHICLGIKEATQIPIISKSALVKTKDNESQTRKNSLERLINVEQAFRVNDPNQVRDKSILLVDDVLTTGATLESCAMELLNAGVKNLNIITLAFAGG